jgi:predicted lipoprotein with Yx(FWY)xxD motif
MRATMKSLLPTLALSLTLAACGGSSYGSGSSPTTGSSTASSKAGSAVVAAASNAALGAQVLTDAHGMTLYTLSGERAGRLICVSSSCVQLWRPVAPSAGTPPSGAASLGTLKRPDGSQQVTYRGMPLYTFSQDLRPGDVKGQHLKDVGVWSAVTVGAAGAPPAKGTESSKSAPAPSGRYGY